MATTVACRGDLDLLGGIEDPVPFSLFVDAVLRSTLEARQRSAGAVFNISLPENLSVIWRPVIERQLALTLAPVRARLKSARVSFYMTEASARGTMRFRCEIDGCDAGGTHYRAEAQHRSGEVAIADAFSRARRTIVRGRRSVVTAR